MPEGPAGEGKTYSVNHRQTGQRFEGNEGKCSRGKWSEIQNVNFCDKNPPKLSAGEERVGLDVLEV